MKKLLLATAVLLAGTVVQADEWKIDKPHSSFQFKVSHLVISKVKGNFDEFEGTLKFDGENLTESEVSVQVEVASVDTDNVDRDNHLRSPDFFDAEKFPTMTFKSTEVKDVQGNKFKLVGDLTIKDVTKQVTFDCEFHGKVDFMETTKAGFSASTTINRKEYGLEWSRVMETGGLVVGDEVEIDIELEFNKVS